MASQLAAGNDPARIRSPFTLGSDGHWYSLVSEFASRPTSVPDESQTEMKGPPAVSTLSVTSSQPGYAFRFCPQAGFVSLQPHLAQ
jgi:hypothetical protein